jgi:hypothetical protein
MDTGFKRNTFASLCAIAIVFSAATVFGQAPSVLSYQGVVQSGSGYFNGPGQFKFALVNSNGATSYWSNDGSSSGGAQPVQPVTIPVSQGLFSVLLGDTTLSNMQPVAAGIFTNSGVRLRIWFSDGTNAFAQLAPDQRVGSVGYALFAANVATGSVTSAQLAPGSVLGANIANATITSAQLAPSAVTSATLAAGAVGLSNLNFSLGYINAKNPPYGARGDGVTDDTVAIQDALNDVGNGGGGIVFLPTGNYYIASQLSVPAQTTLAGVWRAPTAFSQYNGTTLLAVANAGNTNGAPFITLQGPNSVLDGVTVFYPNQVQQNPPTPYPWTVQGGGGDNVTIQNVLLVNPYLGVDLATHTSGRHLIRGLYGEPLLIGISVDQCYDIGRIMDVHFWPFWSANPALQAFTQTNGVSFNFMRTDWEVVQDIFSWGYDIGARFSASTNGAMNGQMSNVNFDNVNIGLQLIATQPYAIHISNLNLANAGGGTNRIGIQSLSGGNCDLDVNGASFWGSFNQCISWNCGDLLSVSNARFLNWNPAFPAVDIESGRAMLQANFFEDVIGTAIHVGTNTDRVMIVGNELTGNTVSLQGPRTLSINNQP